MKTKVKMVKMTEDRFENELTQKWLDGIANGVKQVITFFEQQSGKAYGDRLDVVAKMYRDSADLLTHYLSDVQGQAEKHEKDYLTDVPEIEEFTE